MRKLFFAQNRAGFTRGINATAMYQYDRLTLEFFQLMQAFLELVSGNMFGIRYMACIVFTPLAHIQNQRILVIDELNRYQRVYLIAGTSQQRS